jgi:hypothetical protein
VTNDGVGDRVISRVCAAALLALGTLPFSNWISGGLTDGLYAYRWTGWLYGSAICAGTGVVSALVLRNVRTRLAFPFPARLRSSAAYDGLIAALAVVLYATIARVVFDGRPLLIDEIVQVLQARMYAGGHLSVPVPEPREFFSVLHVVDTGTRMFGQFPPGWPAMLAVGSLVGAEWLVGPVCGGVAVWAFARLVRRVYPDGVWPSLAAVGFALTPFVVFQFGSQMSHGPVTMWILLATLAVHMAGTAGSARDATGAAILAGLAAGCAFAVRPLDAVAFAVVGAAWLARQCATDRWRWMSVAASAVGLAVPVALVMWVNIRTTGAPTLFGYEALWGNTHSLGFHAAPWGDAHTPQRGVELLSLYVTRLNTYLFETPFPSLILVVGGLLVASRLHAIERMLLGGTVIHALLYFAYWHDGFYLGPRFVLPWVPALLLMCVQLGRWLMRASGSPTLRRATAGAGAAAIALVVLTGIPVRVAQYRAGLASMRTDYGRVAADAGVTNALVFVHESWGAQLVARLWALGVSRPAAAALYAHVDACRLEAAITSAEKEEQEGIVAERSMQTLLGDSSRVVASTISPDTTERMLPGAVYDSACVSQVQADQAGYALFPPFLLDRTSGNTYVRDFGARDTVLIQRFTNRPVFRVTRDGVDGTSPLRWERIQ